MLTKYVVVSNFSKTWFDMANSLAEAKMIAGRHINTHVEQWIYQTTEDGHKGPLVKINM